MAEFTNQATLTYNGNTTTSNITVGEIVEVLSATKTPLVNTYTQNGRVTYTVSLINSGNVAFTDLTFTDNLGSYTFGTEEVVPLTYVDNSVKIYVNGALTTPVVVAATNPLTITGINVPASGNVLIVYETTTNGYAPPTAGGSINNTATFDSVTLSNPVTANATVTADSAPILSISKSLSPISVTENGQLTYTFIIQNRGNVGTTAADNVVITDVFTPVLDPITVSVNGALVDQTGYQYDTQSGLFRTNPGTVTVPAASYTVQQDGSYAINPGVTTVVVTGTV